MIFTYSVRVSDLQVFQATTRSRIERFQVYRRTGRGHMPRTDYGPMHRSGSGGQHNLHLVQAPGNEKLVPAVGSRGFSRNDTLTAPFTVFTVPLPPTFFIVISPFTLWTL